jgi:hypothetical protein
MAIEAELSHEERTELIERCKRLKDSISVDGDSAETRIRLANTHLRLGEREEAIAALEIALHLRPNTPAIVSKLRQVCTEEEFARLEMPENIEPFWHDIAGLFKYPFSGSGVYLLICGAVFVTVVQFIVSLPTIFFYGSIMLCLFLSGYLSAYFISVTRSSARGRTAPPDWPDITDMVDNVIRPLIIVTVPGIAAFLPAIAYLIYQTFYGGENLMLVGLIALGGFYYPMALIASVMTGASLNSLNFVGVIGSILRVRKEYFIAQLMLALFSVVSIAAYFAVTVIGKLSGAIVVKFALQFLYLYFMMTYAHLLGLLYRQCESRITS